MYEAAMLNDKKIEELSVGYFRALLRKAGKVKFGLALLRMNV